MSQLRHPDEPTVLARVVLPHAPVNATLFAWKGWYVTLLTYSQPGPRVPLGIEILPALLNPGSASAMRSEWTKRWTAWLPSVSSHELLASPLPHEISLEPLYQALNASGHRNEPSQRSSVRSAEAFALAAFDALKYHFALAEGASPAKSIATDEGITARAAEGRIRRAREQGLLTKPSNKRAPSVLTEKAADLIEGLTGERPYPYVTEDGVTVLGPI